MEKQMSKTNILKKYNENQDLYNNLKDKLIVLIKELLLEKVNYHHIYSRVKEKNSLEKKIDTKDGKYTIIDDITDVVGCRIISYFEDDVEKIVNIIRKEFDIDEKNSVNKKAILESDKFGYLSHHLVCKISKKRLSLPEYEKYKNLKFEIQIRSILQHAWAEIEHDIGYKSSLGIPKELKRKFSRIAGLLETADENFCEIKKAIEIYQEKIEKDENEFLQTDLNLNSLQLFIENQIVIELDNYIAIDAGKSSLDTETKQDSLSNYLDMLSYFNIKTIQELNDLLVSKKTIIKKYANKFLLEYYKENDLSDGSFPKGVTYFYLVYILLLELDNKNLQKIYMDIFHENDLKFLEFIQNIYNSIK